MMSHEEARGILTLEMAESLGERGDILHLAYFINAVLHGLRVFCTRTIERALDASNVVLGPLFVRQANGLHMSMFRSASFPFPF